jgi:hypothetical protein
MSIGMVSRERGALKLEGPVMQAGVGIAYVEHTIATRLTRTSADRLVALRQPSPEA